MIPACLTFSGEFLSPALAAIPLWVTCWVNIAGFGRGKMLPTNRVCCFLISLMMCACWRISALGCLSLEALTAIFKHCSTLFCSAVPSFRSFLFWPPPCSFPPWAPSSVCSFSEVRTTPEAWLIPALPQTLLTTRGHCEFVTRALLLMSSLWPWCGHCPVLSWGPSFGISLSQQLCR